MCEQPVLSPDFHNVRTEYEALISYHNSVISHRFTLLGFFIASVGIILQGGMTDLKAVLLLVLTIGMYMAERRNRVLYTKMSKRAMEIEQNHWKLNRSGDKDKGVPLFCRFRLKELPEELKKDLSEELKKELNEEERKNFWETWRLRFFPASHSTGLDWLYSAVAGYAVLALLIPRINTILKCVFS